MGQFSVLYHPFIDTSSCVKRWIHYINQDLITAFLGQLTWVGQWDSVPRSQYWYRRLRWLVSADQIDWWVPLPSPRSPPPLSSVTPSSAQRTSSSTVNNNTRHVITPHIIIVMFQTLDPFRPDFTLSFSSTTSRELLSQFSTCSGWRWFDVGEKVKKIAMYL